MRHVVLMAILIFSSALSGCLDSIVDDDGDGIKNESDNCPDISNPDQINYDDDSMGNDCDLDDDNDGVEDVLDLCDYGEKNWVSSNSTDIDSDGCQDSSEDTDDDNDGVSDNEDAFPEDSSEAVDTDGDGVGDNSDAFPQDERESSDYDGDGIGDNSDDDDDNDGFSDIEDYFPLDQYEWSDLDADGTGDNADLDDDGDGVFDWNDACPISVTMVYDSDGDGCDDDNDAFPDDSDEWDDSDGDGIGDNSDWDDYGNGVLAIEFTYFSIWDNGQYDGSSGLPDVYAYVGFGDWDGANCNDMVYNENYFDDIIYDAYQLTDWWSLDFDADDSVASTICVYVVIYDEDSWAVDEQLDYVQGEGSSYYFLVDLATNDYDETWYFDNRGENSLSIELEFELFLWTA